MLRQLTGLVLLSLAAFGLSPAQANDTDEAYVLESPPIIEIPSGITAVSDGNRAEPLQPTFNTGGDRVFYDLEVDVLTNGELDNFDVISACVFTESAASTEEQRDSLCGYTEANPEFAPDPDPSKAISMAWTIAGGFVIDGTNSHALGTSTHSTFSTTRNPNSTSIDYDGHRLKYQFALSHAALNRDDWIVRVVAVSTPTTQQGGQPEEAQRTELLLDSGEQACALSYNNQVEVVEGRATCGELDRYGVSFFGGFSSSTNRSVDYGSVNENSSSAVRTSPTGDYYANDLATLTIAASDFFADNGGIDDEIPLVSGSIGDERNTKQITLACDGDAQLLLSATPKNLFSDVPRSSVDVDQADPQTAEDPKTAESHSCQLHYGFGAVFPNSTYGNIVQIGIKDADTGTGPTEDAVEVDPTPDP